MASFTTIMTSVRSGFTYSSTLASWVWRGSCQSVGTAAIRPVVARIGLKSKMRIRRRWFSPKKAIGEAKATLFRVFPMERVMRESPSIVPTNDQDVYLVLDDY